MSQLLVRFLFHEGNTDFGSQFPRSLLGTGSAGPLISEDQIQGGISAREFDISSGDISSSPFRNRANHRNPSRVTANFPLDSNDLQKYGVCSKKDSGFRLSRHFGGTLLELFHHSAVTFWRRGSESSGLNLDRPLTPTHSISKQIKLLRTFLSEFKLPRPVFSAQALFRHSAGTLPAHFRHYPAESIYWSSYWGSTLALTQTNKMNSEQF